MATTFETASIGDEVWSMELGWGVIQSLDGGETYPILVEFQNERTVSYTLGGKRLTTQEIQTLFWDEIELKAPTKPLPKLNKDDCVEVWNTNTIDPTITYKRHFSHFEGGSIFCFGDGGTSWTRTRTQVNGWNSWRKPN